MMRVSTSEHGLVRLFAVDLPAAEIDAFATSHSDAKPTPLAQALGIDGLNPDHYELFDVADLEEMGLSGYMVEGLGIAQADIAADIARLSAQKGWVLIVRSSAFGGLEQTLMPKAPLRWLATYKEDRAPIHFSDLPNQSAKGNAAVPPKNASNPSPQIAVILALLFLPTLVVFVGLLFVWMK